MASQSEADVEALLSWSFQQGSSLAPPVEIYHDDSSGLSFRAREGIVSGTELISARYETTLSWLNVISTSSDVVRDGHGFPREFVEFFSQNDPNVIGHFFLIQQYLLKGESFWWPYINTLPQPNELSIPTLWPEQDQAFFAGTNVEPALQKRQALWHFEWQQAISQLSKHSSNSQKYTFDLYKWAAAIFGSRSFRPSLTISPQLFNYEAEEGRRGLIQSHISNDTFSILFPVLDIGNHNSKDRVLWSHKDQSFTLSSLRNINAGGQIYNFYGTKSNSELLVGYGFLLEDDSLDRVNIKLNNLPQDVQDFRKTQSSHVLPSRNQPEEEFMYYIGETTDRSQNAPLRLLSRGFFDTVICLVASERERDIIKFKRQYSPELDQDIFTGELMRCAHVALQVIKDKVHSELARLEHTNPGVPRNQNQQLAGTYRLRTKSLLDRARTQLQSISPPNLITLDTAYAWLRETLPQVHQKVTKFIAADQEEPLPLDWSILVEDWDHTYLLIWVYIVLTQHYHTGAIFRQYEKEFYEKWLRQILKYAWDNELYVEDSEIETIEATTKFVAGLFEQREEERVRLRNMASYVLKTESVKGVLRNEDDGDVVQEMLCIPGVNLSSNAR